MLRRDRLQNQKSDGHVDTDAKNVDDTRNKGVAHNRWIEAHSLENQGQDGSRQSSTNDHKDQRKRNHPDTIEIRRDPERNQHSKDRQAGAENETHQ